MSAHLHTRLNVSKITFHKQHISFLAKSVKGTKTLLKKIFTIASSTPLVKNLTSWAGRGKGQTCEEKYKSTYEKILIPPVFPTDKRRPVQFPFLPLSNLAVRFSVLPSQTWNMEWKGQGLRGGNIITAPKSWWRWRMGDDIRLISHPGLGWPGQAWASLRYTDQSPLQLPQRPEEDRDLSMLISRTIII